MEAIYKKKKPIIFLCLSTLTFAANSMSKKPVKTIKSPYLSKEMNIKKLNAGKTSFTLSTNNKYIATGDNIIEFETNKAIYKVPNKLTCLSCRPFIEFISKHDRIIIFHPKKHSHKEEYSYEKEYNPGIENIEIKKFDPIAGKIIEDERLTIKINLELYKKHAGSIDYASVEFNNDGDILSEIIYTKNGEILIQEYRINFHENTYSALKPLNIKTKIIAGKAQDIYYSRKYKYIAIIYSDENNIKKLKLINTENENELTGPEIKLSNTLYSTFITPAEQNLIILDNITTNMPKKNFLEKLGLIAQKNLKNISLEILTPEKETYTIIKKITFPNKASTLSEASSLDISPSGELIALANSTTNEIDIININSGILIQKLTGHKKQNTKQDDNLSAKKISTTSKIITLLFSDDGEQITSLDNLNDLKIWTLEPLKIHPNKKNNFNDVRIHF